MNFDYNIFIKNLLIDFKDTFSEQEIRNIINIESEISKDTPLSTGKRLIINHLSFSGKKITEEDHDFSNQFINYSQDISSGINIWVADNFKGKSSLFKIIKFALTGKNTLKQNVSKWIDKILLIFSINEKKYTVFIDNSKRQINASLYYKEIKEYPTDSVDLKDVEIFNSTSKEEFQRQLEEFFFNQFDYYSLKWTQKNSAKDNNDLLEPGTSWLTYFKSMFLESKDSGELIYGAQGTKVFQMLLGLHLTSPINKLTVTKDKLLHEKGKQLSYISNQNNENRFTIESLHKSLSEINLKIDTLTSQNNNDYNIDDKINLYNNLINKLESNNERALLISNELKKCTYLIQRNRKEEYKINEEFTRLNREINKISRQEIDIKEYLEIGILFSNLDLKTCPSCNHNVTKEKKEKAALSHTCAVCNDDVSGDNIEFDKTNLENKLNQILNLKKELTGKVQLLEKKLFSLSEELKKAKSTELKLENDLKDIRDTTELNNEILNLKKILNEDNKKLNNNNLNKLIEERAILNYKIDQLKKAPEKIDNNQIEQKILLITRAIEILNNIRFEEGKKILDKLSNLMVIEAKLLGLRISEILINNRFDIKYKQDGDFLSFSDIAEGEQLRAKLALYLSLIQLDIEYNHGRHSRFIIIDSPSKEEVDKNYLYGFSSLIRDLETRFGDKLQILIGTAERGFENTVKNQNISLENKYIF